MALVTPVLGQVPEYHVYCDPDEYAFMVENWSEDIEIECSVSTGDTLYSNALIRLRGDSSRGYPKKSYRITFDADQPHAGRTEWNFNGEYLDETYMHAWLYSWLMGQLDYPCFQVDHVELYVNDAYLGLYVRLEPVDEQFLADRGMDPDANLYKASLDGACLSAYDDVSACWEKKANESENWTDLYQLIEFLDQADPDSFHITAGEVFDIDRMITMVAVNTLTMNFSTYYHNYYMYRDIRGTGKWTMLPWDVDKLWGNWIMRTYTEGVYPAWFDNPFMELVIINPVLLDIYFNRMETIGQETLSADRVNPVIDSLQAVLAQSVEADTMDAITPEEFEAAVGTLRDTRIPERASRVMLMYDEDPRSFRAFRGDTVSLGDKLVRWRASHLPAGGEIQYRLYLYTAEGWHTDPCRYVELADTCYTFDSLAPGEYVWRVEACAGSRFTESYNHYNPFRVLESWSLLSGTIQGSVTLSPASSPYYVSGDLEIPAGASLVVEGGVDLRLAAGVDIVCQGQLSCLGTASDSVRFIPNVEFQPWGGISLQDAGADFGYTSFSGSSGWNDGDICLVSEDSDLSLVGCSFSNNYRCVNIHGGSAIVDSCDFTGFNSGELFFMDSGQSATVRYSLFGNMVDPPTSSHDGVEFQNCRSGSYSISGCDVFNIDGDCIDLNSSSVTIDSCRVWNATDKGLSIGVGSGGGEPSSAQITGCIVSDCVTGVAVKDESSAQVVSTTVTECDVGVRTYSKTSGYGPGDVSVVSSIFHLNGVPFSFEQGSNALVEYCLTGSSEPWQGQGNIAGDPRFAAWEDGGCRLSWDSPCIDSGSPELEDPDGTRSDMGAHFFPQVFEGLALNELQAVNDTTLADVYGEYDDWFELYNGTDYDCDLSWLYVTDDPRQPDLYRFPPGTVIPSEGFLVVWADGHTWQDGLHAGFRLSGEGDSLYLFHQSAAGPGSLGGTAGCRGYRQIDRVCYGPMDRDVSIGRLPDGTGDWCILDYCTPGWSNSVTQQEEPFVRLSCPYPNPTRSGTVSIDVTADAGLTELLVYDLAGRLVDTAYSGNLEAGEHRLHWDLRNSAGRTVPPGLYLMLARHAGGVTDSRKLIVLHR